MSSPSSASVMRRLRLRVSTWIARERAKMWRSVHVELGRRDGQPYTSIRVAHRTSEGAGALVVTTARRSLRVSQFGPAATAINEATAPRDAARRAEWRALYAVHWQGA